MDRIEKDIRGRENPRNQYISPAQQNENEERWLGEYKKERKYLH